MQEEIFNRFVADADTGLLFLGFCDKNVALSPSLEYWRDFAGLFTRELSRTPELELFRHQTSRCIFIIAQKFYNFFGMFNVF